MGRLARLPPARRYKDTPPWAIEGGDSVKRRAVEAAWNRLHKQDFIELKFNEIAREAGVTPPALYHHFVDLPDLGRAVAEAAMAMLKNEIVTAVAPLEDSKHFATAVRAFLEFARKRPRHFALAFAPEYAEDTRIDHYRQGILENLGIVLETATGKPTTQLAMRLFFAQLLGAATLANLGLPLEEAALMRDLEKRFIKP
jgi:AcrR family transcriptional regulator